MRVRVIVRGRVQGVGFRYGVERRAAPLDLAGWVRNVPDGTLEAVFEGSPEAVQSLVEFCRRGPRGARVDAVEVMSERDESLSGFCVR